jgi:hypothetical protein
MNTTATRMVQETVPLVGGKSSYRNEVVRDEGHAASRALENAVLDELRANLRPTAPVTHSDREIVLADLARRGHGAVPERYRERGGAVRMSEDEREFESVLREVARAANIPPIEKFRTREQTLRLMSEIARRVPRLAPRVRR